MKNKILLMILPCMMMAKPVYVDEILTEKGTVKLDMSINYSNIQQAQGTKTVTNYQTQNGDFVLVPTYLGESKSNQDYLNYTFTLRYGLTTDLELFTSANLYYSKTSISLNDSFDSMSSKGLNAVNIGMTYQLKKEDETPSLLLGVSTNVLEKTKFDTQAYTNHFKQYRVFATSFYTVDPVVFLLSSSYGVNLKKQFKENSIKSGDIFTISPQVYFAVNPYTSLNGGIKYTHYSENNVNDKQVSSSRSNLSFLMGMSYEFSNNLTMTMSAEFLNSNEVIQNNISSTFSYSF